MKKFLFLISAFLFWACSESGSRPTAERAELSADLSHEGMILVRATGRTATLGTNGKAKSDETPAMKASFGYDFSIGRSEVTCDEYNAIAERPVECSGKVPVTSVTYFDAALFANERSKSEGLDTAYEYSVAVFSDAGNCTSLEGFAFRPSREAYRLPTEAEWILVAGGNWNPSASWNAENSDYRSHDVCTAGDSENEAEPCDMAGNVLEWVNDWAGKFLDTALVNFAGASDGGSLGKRVVKGGSFRNDKNSMTLYSRGDTYTVTSSTFANYVGFRLAFGKIPDAVFLNSSGQTTSSPVLVKASSGSLKEKLGTFRAKLAFRNDETGNIGFVNYQNSLPSVVEISDTLDAYHPAISPDGKRVAFCTRPEGISGRSELYVRNLDANGANLVRLDVESAAIPRWRVVGADTQIVYVTSAENNSDAANWKLASTWMVPFADGKFGTPEKLFDGTFNGGVSADGKLAVGGARLLRANLDGRDTLWYNGEQACNASLSDSSKETLFLDFGSETGKAFAEKSYDAHGMLLLADSAGRLSKMIPAPEGYTFDHTEWMHGNPEYAVATFTDAEGAHSKIVLVNVLDSSVLELAEGTELWHPDLWVAKKMLRQDEIDLDLDPDSAGVYLDNESYALLSYKMKLFWKFKDSVEVALLGSSRATTGLDPSRLSYWSLNMANIPNDMNISHFLAVNYFLKHSPSLKTIVVEISPDLWDAYDSVSSVKSQLSAKGFIFDSNHDFWPEGVSDEFLELAENAPLLSDEEYAARIETRGFSTISESLGWLGGTSSVEMLGDSTRCEDSVRYLQDFGMLESLVLAAQNRNVQVVGLVFPLAPEYKNTGAYGRHGMKRSVAAQVLQRVEALQKTYPNFHYMDENKMGDHDYTDEMAYDYDHLNAVGAARLTARLDSLLKTLP